MTNEEAHHGWLCRYSAQEADWFRVAQAGMEEGMIHRHHRVLGNREDNRPVNILVVDDEVHRWIHDNPAEAMELGWIVSKHDDPENISVCIPKTIIAQPEKKERKKKASTPEERKARKNFTITTPNGEEQIIPELVENARKILPGRSKSPAHYVVVDALVFLLQHAHLIETDS